MTVDRNVLLAVDESTAGLTPDDAVFADALLARGWRVSAHRWGDAVPAGDVVVIRSTWDYVESPTAFAAWLDQLDADQAIVHNPTALLRWNVHKGYLVDLAGRGVPVVPTALVARGSETTLAELTNRYGWDDVVVKPAVGGTARLAVRMGEIGAEAAGAHLQLLLDGEDAVAQPYVSTITTSGEISVVVIAGQPQLAVAKHARAGDWRVQSEFGGSVEEVSLTAELRAMASRTVGAIKPTPSYARVDMVRHASGALLVLELELVEPELFFSLDPTVAAHLAEHIERDVRQTSPPRVRVAKRNSHPARRAWSGRPA